MQTLVLNFHGLGPVPGHVPAEEAPYWIAGNIFRDYLAQIRDLAVTRPVHITFDDGNKSDLEIALPLLLEYGFKADFFVCAGRIGAPFYLDRPDITELAGCGMGVGCHGMDHVNWHQTDRAGLHREIVEARQCLEDVCGHPVRDFAVPFGAYDRRALALIRETEGTCVYTSDRGTADMGRFIRPRNTLKAGFPVRIADLEPGPISRLIWRLRAGVKRVRGGPA